MDGAAGWRVIEADEPEAEPSSRVQATSDGSGISRLAVGAVAALVLSAAGLAIWATLPTGDARVESSNDPFAARLAPELVAGAGASSAAAPLSASIVVDVEGAVVTPGLHEVPDGSRVGEAIAAAGGYSATVDIPATTVALNLAEKVKDGQQIHVPVLGEDIAGGGGTTSAPPAGGGSLVDVNHATAEELDTLPGIGPVTAAKIIDARTQAPFATVDELQSRGVLGPSTFEKLRALVTVTP